MTLRYFVTKNMTTAGLKTRFDDLVEFPDFAAVQSAPEWKTNAWIIFCPGGKRRHGKKGSLILRREKESSQQ